MMHQHEELSSKNDEEHNLDSVTDSSKIEDDGLLTEGASTDCIAKDERMQQEKSAGDSGDFNSDVVLSPRRLFSVGSEYATTVSTDNTEENDCRDRLTEAQDEASAREIESTSGKSEDADDARDNCVYNNAQTWNMLPSVSVSVSWFLIIIHFCEYISNAVYWNAVEVCTTAIYFFRVVI
uniref:Transmembrane protein n=1 Tax=Ascaris lumbricoides TaxID=6252 RepID=A0A0M3IA81_ASCLU